jgi:hypothetical protein
MERCRLTRAYYRPRCELVTRSHSKESKESRALEGAPAIAFEVFEEMCLGPPSNFFASFDSFE